MELRPVRIMIDTLKPYPSISQMVELFRAGRGKDLPDWPDWCFMPLGAWYSIVSAAYNVPELPLSLVSEVAKLGALGTWRYNQGIYRLDKDLMAALTNSPISGIIPCEVLYRLPEWCIYVETPDLQWLDKILHGFWAHLEWDPQNGRSELRFLLDCENNCYAMPLHLGNWDIAEAVDRAASEAEKHTVTKGINLSFESGVTQALAAQITPLMAVLLYICSEKPEIDDERQPGAWPSHPRPKKVKKGLRLFPPDKPRIWSVGTSIGEQLRRASAAGEASTATAEPGSAPGRPVRTHLRRGHWHGYWTGPLKEERRFVYHWLSPLIVKGNPDEEKAEEQS